MQQIYSNVGKVLVDSRQGSNLLYLPLDKLMAASAAANSANNAANNSANASASNTATSTGNDAPVGSANNASNNGSANAPPLDIRSRDLSRSRDRDGR